MSPTIAILEQAKRDIAKALVELKSNRSLDAACSLQDADVAIQVVRDVLREERGLKQSYQRPSQENLQRPPVRGNASLKLIRGGKR